MTTRRPSLGHLLLAVATVVTCAAAQAAAQVRPPAPTRPAAKPHRPAPHAGSVEVSGGVVWDGGFDLGTLAATETRNTGTDPLELFTTESRVGAVIGAAGRVGYFITPAFSVEGGFQFSRPEVSTAISGDFEGAPGLTATEAVGRYVFDVTGLWHLQALAFARRSAVPYLFGGAGYIRELHEGDELVETGSQVGAGLGIRFWFSQGPRRYGLRSEVGVVSREGGVDFDDARRTVPRVSASFFVVF